MNIMIVSQCNKKALTETRRIVDQFAMRVGDRTWLTPITQQGLNTLRSLLQKTARKNTAVACHYIHGQNRMELLWIVGDRQQFDEDGQVPTHSTQRNILRNEDEHTWHSAGQVHYGGRMAALFHDFGKANAWFAQKLKQARLNKQPVADPYRHEWVSLRLFEAFVMHHGAHDDVGWLKALANLRQDHTPCLAWLDQLQKDHPDVPPRTSQPLKHLPPIAQWIGWLIVSHHRLPTADSWPAAQWANILTLIKAENCHSNLKEQPDTTALPRKKTQTLAQRVELCWTLPPESIPMMSHTWRTEASRCARRLLHIAERLAQQATVFEPSDPYQAHVSRLLLMLADHHYSSQPANPQQHDPSYAYYANTDRDGQLKQPLDDHLVGVSRSIADLMPALLKLRQILPSLIDKKSLTKPAKQAKFVWQDKAFALAKSLQAQSAQQGFFGVNLASTGCGKTLANARIMYGLADPEQGARFNIALGLRTLTLQTGQALRSRLGLSEHEVAVLVGGGAVRELFDHHNNQHAAQARQADRSDDHSPHAFGSDLAEWMGSESLYGLDSADDHLHFAGNLPQDHVLVQWFKQHPDIKKLLSAPILSCTIDHLIPATESTRGGRQIAPMLRLMSSDLVIDEPDDFAPEDWYALARLVNWAGLLGSRVLLSSATLTPAEVNGLFLAYQAGRARYRQHRCVADTSAAICCAWFDEFGCQSLQATNADAFKVGHKEFTQARATKLATQPQRRHVAWVGASMDWTKDQWAAQLADTLRGTLLSAHHANSQTDPHTGKHYSIGLIRMANINSIAALAQQLIAAPLAEHTRLHVCVYHSRFPLLIRSSLEHQLDQLLNRQQHAPHDHPWLHAWLQQYPEQQHVVVVLASPVAEVGRDHDYDWMVVEPSSMRAIIQVVGRVRRHRDGAYAHPNVFLLETNTRHYRNPSAPVFCKPGFESSQSVNGQPALKLQTHDLKQLLRPEHIKRLDAEARLRPPAKPEPYHYLADLEHLRMAQVLLPHPQQHELSAHHWWTSSLHHTAYLQRKTRFRQSIQEELVAFVADEPDQPMQLQQFNANTGNWLNRDGLCVRVPLSVDPQVSLWPQWDWTALLHQLDDDPEDWATHCRRYLSLNLQTEANNTEKTWQYHDWLGFFN